MASKNLWVRRPVHFLSAKRARQLNNPVAEDDARTSLQVARELGNAIEYPSRTAMARLYGALFIADMGVVVVSGVQTCLKYDYQLREMQSECRFLMLLQAETVFAFL